MRSALALLLGLIACGNSTGLGGDSGGSTQALTLGEACNPLSLTDGCTLDGYLCTEALDGGEYCGYAYLGDPCLIQVGCAPDSGLRCDLFPASSTGGEAEDLCTLPCASPDDCGDPAEDCFPVAGDGGGCEYNSCTDANSLCQVGDNPDGGTCLAIDSNGDLLCFQNGAAPLGGPCEQSRRDGGAFLCGPGAACLNGTEGETACILLCVPPDAGCPGGQVCEATLQVCATPCTTNAQCAGGFSCQQDFDAYGNPIPDAGMICLLP